MNGHRPGGGVDELSGFDPRLGGRVLYRSAVVPWERDGVLGAAGQLPGLGVQVQGKSRTELNNMGLKVQLI